MDAVLWVDMIVTTVIAALSGMGIGSGGLLVLYLTFFRGTDQLSAQGMNLLFFLFAAAASMSVHLSRRNIRYLAVVIAVLGALPGAWLGSALALRLPGEWMTRLFGIFLVLVGFPTLFSPKKGSDKQKDQKFEGKI